MFTELRTLLQRVICSSGLFSQSMMNSESQASTDIAEDPRIDNRAAQRLVREMIDFDYKTSLRLSLIHI